MADRNEIARRKEVIAVAKSRIRDALEAAEVDYGHTFRKNGAHQQIVEEALSSFHRKPGRKPKSEAKE